MSNFEIISSSEHSVLIEKMINDSDKFLIIVSPFLKIHSRLKILLTDASNRCNNLIFIFRESSLSPNEQKWLQSIKNTTLINVKELHSKIYLNENSILLTSLNLHEYSQVNNFELGVFFQRPSFRNEYQKVLGEISGYIKVSNSNFSITPIYEAIGYFNMGQLCSDLQNRFNFEYEKDLDGFYKFVCSEARKIIKFNKEDFYKDGSRILRMTSLTPNDYTKLYKTIAEKGIKKRL